jgi:hypothetical protein
MRTLGLLSGLWIGCVLAWGQPSVNFSLFVDNPNPVVGQTVNFQTSSNPAAGGAIVYRDSGQTIFQTQTGNGSSTFSTNSLSIGTHAIQATLTAVGGGSFSSNVVSVTVSQIPTSTSLSAAPNPSTVGQNVNLTAAVAVGITGTTQPSGSIAFTDNGTTLATLSLGANSAATLTFAFQTVGNHSIVATYNDPAHNFASSTSPTVVQVVNSNKSNSTTTLTSSANPSTFGQAVTFTATVSAPPATVTNSPPSGTVTFNDNGVAIGTATLANGTAAITTSPGVGTHAITASYPGDSNFNASTSNTVNQVVNKVATTTTLIVVPIASTVGQTVNLTATVSPATATGTVTFTDNGATIGQGTLTNGVATLAVNTLTAGTHSLVAAYAGNTNFNASTSAAVTQTVASLAPTLTVSPNPAAAGQAVTLTAILPSTLLGAVTFQDNGAQIGSAPVIGGTASLVLTFTAGTHTLTASYNGANSAPVTLVVAPTVSLTASPNPAAQSQSVTLTATVTPSTATGTIVFQDNGTTVAQAALSNGIASAVVTFSTTGQHQLTAKYSGDNTYAASQSPPISFTVTAPSNIATTTFLTVAPNPQVFGQLVLMTATVNPAAGSTGSPTGTVTFRDSGVLIGSIQLNNGTAVFSTAALQVGNHTITVVYGGDNTFTSSTSPAVVVVINPQPTSVFLTATPTSAQPGQSVLLSAQVSPSTATGTVTFRDGSTQIGSADIIGGLAATTVSTLANGSHTITAVYGGNASFGGSTSNPVTVSVGQILTNTTTTVTVSPNPATYGDNVTLTAKVTPAAATGLVTFTDGTTNLGSTALSAGTATFSTSKLSAGTHSLAASYGGDSGNGASTSAAVSLTVAQAKTSTALGASPNPSSPGQTVTLTATVTPSTATGAVAFADGSTSLGSVALNGGTATFTTSNLAVGTHSLTATYGGDTNYLGSASVPLSQVVTSPSPGAPQISGPASLPNGTVGTPYSQTFTATGGTGQLTWTMTSSTTNDLTLSSSGVLAGTPKTAGTFQLSVQVRDSASPPRTDSRTLSVTLNFPTLPAISVSVSSSGGQNVPQVSFGQGYSVPVTGTFTLTFTPNASNLPSNYTNPDVKFANGTTSAQIDIPGNSTAPVSLPPVQLGSVAGTINVTLTALKSTQTGQAVPLPSQAPATTIVVARAVPVIVPGSVKITNITSTGFNVTFNASSNPRDLAGNGATLTFTAASGTILNGTSFTVSLAAPGTTYFQLPEGLANGGALSATIPFNYTGDTSAIGTVSVTITNSVGTSAAQSGGR